MVKIFKLNNSKSKELELHKFLKNNFELDVISYPEVDFKNSVIIFCNRETDSNEQIKDISTYQTNEKISSNMFSKKIVASNGNSKILLNIDTILYFYYEENSVNVVIDDNSIFKVNHSLSFWENKLSEEHFIRCQKGFLVNIEKAVEVIPYFNATLALKFKGHDKFVPVGRKFVKQFKDIICW